MSTPRGDPPDPSQLLSAELDQFGRDPIYEAAVRAASEVALLSHPTDDKQGVSDAVERAFRRHYGQVYRYIRRRTGVRERAEDLTQEVFAAAAAALPRFRRRAGSALPWLYTVARRRFVDELRRRGREGGVEQSGVRSSTAPAWLRR